VSSAITWDGLDDAIIGKSTGGRVVYDVELILGVLMARDKMDRTDAEDFFWFNIEGARVGEMTPIHVFVGEDEIYE
jgi:hypothetical protein